MTAATILTAALRRTGATATDTTDGATVTPTPGTTAVVTATLDTFGWTYTEQADGTLAVPAGQFA